MHTHSETSSTPAARRRHAHLVTACARLIGDLGAAASRDVYDPIAATPGRPVTVHGETLERLALSAGHLLDHARELDRREWPSAVATEAATRTSEQHPDPVPSQAAADLIRYDPITAPALEAQAALYGVAPEAVLAAGIHHQTDAAIRTLQLAARDLTVHPATGASRALAACHPLTNVITLAHIRLI